MLAPTRWTPISHGSSLLLQLQSCCLSNTSTSSNWCRPAGGWPRATGKTGRSSGYRERREYGRGRICNVVVIYGLMPGGAGQTLLSTTWTHNGCCACRRAFHLLTGYMSVCLAWRMGLFLSANLAWERSVDSQVGFCTYNFGHVKGSVI